MKTVIMLSCFVATNAMALDFDKEWARYASDFEKLKQKTGIEVAHKSTKLPEKTTEVNVLHQVDPKSPARLGHTLSDPNMRDRVIDAYNKPNAVVYSVTLN